MDGSLINDLYFKSLRFTERVPSLRLFPLVPQVVRGGLSALPRPVGYR